MKDDKEKNEETVDIPDVNRTWIPPQLIVLNAGATAGGPTLNTWEAASYHS